MKLYTGTSGWAYKEWKGPFYPETLKNDAMLAYYSEQLPAVEVNNTFYRMPAKGALAKWRDQVGPDFRFVLKAPQRITHHSKLTDTDSLAFFLDAADNRARRSRSAHICSNCLRSCARTCRGCATSSPAYRPVARRRSSSAMCPGSMTRSTPRCATAARRSASPRAAKRSTRRSFRPRAGAT